MHRSNSIWLSLARRTPFSTRGSLSSLLNMSAKKGTIDSFFRSGSSKKRDREERPENDEVSAKRPTVDHEGQNKTNDRTEGNKVPLSPEQKQMIEKKRLLAVEKLQEKSGMVLTMGETWREALCPEFKKDYFLKVIQRR